MVTPVGVFTICKGVLVYCGKVVFYVKRTEAFFTNVPKSRSKLFLTFSALQ